MPGPNWCARPPIEGGYFLPATSGAAVPPPRGPSQRQTNPLRSLRAKTKAPVPAIPGALSGFRVGSTNPRLCRLTGRILISGYSCPLQNKQRLDKGADRTSQFSGLPTGDGGRARFRRAQYCGGVAAQMAVLDFDEEDIPCFVSCRQMSWAEGPAPPLDGPWRPAARLHPEARAGRPSAVGHHAACRAITRGVGSLRFALARGVDKALHTAGEQDRGPLRNACALPILDGYASSENDSGLK